MHLLSVYSGDITKFLWGRLEASPPQLFGRGGDHPHGVGAYGRDVIRTCVFRTCVFHPCNLVLAFLILPFSSLVNSHLGFPYLGISSTDTYVFRTCIFSRPIAISPVDLDLLRDS